MTGSLSVGFFVKSTRVESNLGILCVLSVVVKGLITQNTRWWMLLMWDLRFSHRWSFRLCCYGFWHFAVWQVLLSAGLHGVKAQKTAVQFRVIYRFACSCFVLWPLGDKSFCHLALCYTDGLSLNLYKSDIRITDTGNITGLSLRDYRLPPRCKWDLHSFGILHSVGW